MGVGSAKQVVDDDGTREAFHCRLTAGGAEQAGDVADTLALVLLVLARGVDAEGLAEVLLVHPDELALAHGAVEAGDDDRGLPVELDVLGLRDVENADGTTTAWMIEGATPNTLLRRGFTREAVKAGTEITIIGFRAKNGANRANGRDLILPDGSRLFMSSTGTGAPGDSEAPAEPAEPQ